MTDWKYWQQFGHDLPELAHVATRVLSKHVGIGAVERTHKKMKNVIFNKSRGCLNVVKASNEVYFNHNQQKLDNIASADIDELFAWSEDAEENAAYVASAAAVVLDDVESSASTP